MANEQHKQKQREEEEQHQEALTEDGQSTDTGSDTREQSGNGGGDVDERGVPWRNVAAEYRRKYDKLQRQFEELRASMQQPQQQVPPVAQTVPVDTSSVQDDVEAELLRAGYDPQAVKLLSKMIAKRIESVMSTVAPVVEDTYTAKMEQQLAKLKQDAAIGALVSAYEKEIRDALAEVKQPALRADERTIRAALGLAISADPTKLANVTASKRPATTSMAESTPPSGNNVPSGGVDQEELIQFIQDTGIDEDRARAILAKRKKVLSSTK